MKVMAVLGSRNPAGQTAQATEALLQGVKNKGGQGEQVFLPSQRIERCRQCGDTGWGVCRTEGRCVIGDDDFASIAAKIKQAGAVIFATPVYSADLSESMRAFLDRLYRTCRHEAGKVGIEGKPAIGICVAGGGGRGAPACAVSMEKLLTLCGFEIVDMVPVRRQNLEMKLTVLGIAGEWLAEQTKG